ncbi:hypothetical protein A6E15_15710 [Natrinema saccharevitans]|uniref:Uncharacterized protein n=1 Tax=Natrinema saccharevitans TaxID=301967 RepID=A0A1S8B082_9EURY|nr:hypothetical protein [Natrinema saccharevitans]OLZ42322.1 hypothetical protein A6E15_15710 [Natrinema saccharevitans]
MTVDQDPIPQEALPPRWGLAERCEGRFVYRHARPRIDLIADCVPARSHPTLGLCRHWELQYRYFLTDRSISRSIGRVSTRRAAVDGLLECMCRVHERVSTADDPLAVGTVLEDVSLADLVPDRFSESPP